MYRIKTKWVDKVAFDSQIDNHTVRTDAKGPMGDDSGPSPKKLLLAGLAGCTGIDVIPLLEKMRVPVEGFEMNIEADLTDEHPKVFSEIRLVYRFYGSDLNRDKIEKAVKLSKEKYCGVSAMLEKNSPITFSIEYVEH